MKKNPFKKQHLSLLLIFLFVFGMGSYADTPVKKVTLDVKNIPLRKVFKQIKEQTEVKFIYSEVEIQKASNVTLKFENQPLKTALDLIFKNQPYTYEIESDIVIVKPKPATDTPEKKKTRTIKGQVLDENNQPIAGANIWLKGTTTGVPSDVNGNYVLTFDEKYNTVMVSFIGYKTIEMPLGKQEVINFKLEPDKETLDEVVVTGYQTISKERSTGAFAKVSATTLETRRLDNLSSVLEGQVAGYSDGIIRGVSTMNAMQTPLYVIDGFPVENTTIDAYGNVTENIPDLNMEDIESITILKDAAATSIYGARAANGVVVIVTKKAKQGKTQVQLSGSFTIHPYSYYTGNLTNSADIIELEKYWATQNAELNNGIDRAIAEAENLRNNYSTLPSAGTNILLDLYTNKISQAEADAKLAELSSRGFGFYKDVEKYAKRNPFYQQYNLSVGKATDRNNFNLSVSYRNNKEEDRYTKNDQVGVNITNSLQLTSWLKADVGVYISFKNKTEQTYDLFSSYSAGFTASPYDRLKENGTPVTIAAQQTKTVRDNIANYGLYSLDIVPLDELDRRLNKTREFNNRLYGKLDIKILPWLSYNTMFQYEYGVSRLKRLEEMESLNTRQTVNKFATNNNGEALYNLPAGDIFYTQEHHSNAYNFRQQINVDKTFNDLHNVTWIIGQEIRNTKLEYNSLTRYGYDSGLLSSQYIDETKLTAGFSGLMNSWASLTSPRSQSELVNRFVSFYSNIAYSFDNRYTLSGSIRWDRSNLWGTNSKYQNKPLWSVGANWNINRESFFNVNWIDLLKLRASYGIGGNIAKDAAPYLTANYYASTLVGGLYGNISSPPNPNLRWEKTTTINVGIDFSVLTGRLSGTFEVYNKKSVDLLANQMGVPTEGFGYRTLSFNNGAMRNRGFELTLQGDILRETEVKWNAGFLFGYNKNKVTKINVTAPVYYLQMDYPMAYPREGKPYNAIYAYKWAGLSEKGEPQMYDLNGEITTTKYTDLEAIHYAGTSVPVYSGSFTNTLNYKNFEFSFMLLYAGGHKIRNTNIPTISMGRTVSMTNKDIRKRWQEAGDEEKTNVPRLLFSTSPEFNYARESIYGKADIHVLDASYIKINNLSLSYRVPVEWVKKIGLGAARVQFNIENLATLAFNSKAGVLLGSKNKPNYVCGLYLNF
ncbi:SusC/RagA family TonB-linked outer membrane protein [Butyricimonas hominis]|uniref:SusC/RagA family TonB-linked outer membrane protein n=1 Tax=Butyricimonas hominis TaxID=2763032 RepID=A0ABR7D760_9BACT|nr:SusC/RagA family TonB-linked outer membrane protein [Butyricimonas hominis]MBC5623629.1 SusC/RagA family TonB-linked outer membrane protein [Butyricimonas hominis]